MMNRLLNAELRRQWPLVGAALVLVVFLATHAAVFGPAAARYARAMRQAKELGLTFDPAAAAVLPPRVFALVGDNTMPSAVANDQGGSGILTARLLEDVTRLAERRGLDVVQTEPGALSNDERTMVVRAHLQMRGSYGAFVGLLEDLARMKTLHAVDRFTMTPAGASRGIDLWVSRLVLKRDGGTK